MDFSFERLGQIIQSWSYLYGICNKRLEDLDSIPSGMVLGFDGDTLETSDKVGVFYLDNQTILSALDPWIEI